MTIDISKASPEEVEETKELIINKGLEIISKFLAIKFIHVKDPNLFEFKDLAFICQIHTTIAMLRLDSQYRHKDVLGTFLVDYLGYWIDKKAIQLETENQKPTIN